MGSAATRCSKVAGFASNAQLLILDEPTSTGSAEWSATVCRHAPVTATFIVVIGAHLVGSLRSSQWACRRASTGYPPEHPWPSPRRSLMSA